MARASSRATPTTGPEWSRRRLLGGIGAVGAVASLAALAGCTPERAETSLGGDAGPPRVTERALTGSTDPVEVRVGLILGPPSMGLSRFLLDAQAGSTYNRYSFEVTGVDYAALAARFNQNEFDIVTLPSNLGAVLYNNDDIDTEARVINIGNLGVLYIATTDPGIASLEDLQGRTVYSIGEGGTPEYTIATILANNGLDDAVHMSYRATPFEVLNLLQQEENCVAMLPQPFVELARTMVPTLYTPVDITEEWAAMPGNTGGSEAVTTHTLVNRAFLEAHEAAVVEYLQRAGDSVDYTLEHIPEAAALQEQLGTFLNDEVAEAAMPFCSIVSLTGEVMYDALSGFLEAVHEQNPRAVGGRMPGNDFYYMPPSGALEVDIERLIAQQAGTAVTG